MRAVELGTKAGLGAATWDMGLHRSIDRVCQVVILVVIGGTSLPFVMVMGNIVRSSGLLVRVGSTLRV